MRSKKIKKIQELKNTLKKLKKTKKKIIFTNGCFDLIHVGHIDYLKKAKRLGDVLVVAINSDSSVRKIKGKTRPITPESERAEILSSFTIVDYVIIFNELNPIKIISELLPNVLVKGGDWKISEVLGRDIVEDNGGKVITIPPVKNKSTTNIITKVLKNYKAA